MLLLGTSNVNKVSEFTRLLKEVSLCGLSEVGCEIEVDESGLTYAENAALKAVSDTHLTLPPILLV